MNNRISAALVASAMLSVAGCLDPDFYVDYNEPPPPAVVHPTVVQPTVVQPTVVQPVPAGYVQPVYVYPNGGHSGSIRPPRHRYHDDDYRRGGRHDSHHGKASSGPKVPDYAIRNRAKAQQQQQKAPSAKPALKSNSVSPTKAISPSKPASKPVSKPVAKPAPKPVSKPAAKPASKPAAKPPKNPPPKKK